MIIESYSANRLFHIQSAKPILEHTNNKKKITIDNWNNP